MNVVTGVFVESALATARQDRESEVMRQVRRLFDLSDTDGNGLISWPEFACALATESKAKLFKALGIEPSDARGLFVLLDADESGEISVQEFTDGCLRLQGPAKAID